MPSFMISAALAALAILPAVSAHGFVSKVKAGGKEYAGGDPVWFYGEKPDSVGWYAKNQDLGFVSPAAYGTGDIVCHIGATPGNKYVEVEAGSEIDLVWNTWPESHHGPIVNYLARCNGDCTKISQQKKENLKFFKIQEAGLVNGADMTFETDKMMSNSLTSKVKIPSNISGNFVLRHEIIALHSAGQENGAQNYPQCINIKVKSSSKSANPCNEGADCRKGSQLYKATDKGILFNLYTSLTSYPIPGPKIFKGLQKRVATAFKA